MEILFVLALRQPPLPILLIKMFPQFKIKITIFNFDIVNILYPVFFLNITSQLYLMFEYILFLTCGSLQNILILFSCPDESLRQLYTYPCHYRQTDKDLLLFDIQSDPRAL